MRNWYVWISDPKKHTCSCGHVSWAHWSNGQCAHCNCTVNDSEPEPNVKQQMGATND